MARVLFIIGIWLLSFFPSHANNLKSISLIDGKMIDWQLDNASQIYTYGDISIKITNKQSGDDESITQFELMGPNARKTEFSHRGEKGKIGIARLDLEQDRYVIFQIDDGGAHCCHIVRFFDLENDSYVDLEPYDYGTIQVADLDGNGFYEFVTYDRRFSGFSSYAQNMQPLRIFNMLSISFPDVSDEPQFQPFHEKRFQIQARNCNGVVKDNPGACAGLLGTAALLQLDEATALLLDFETSTKKDYAPSYSLCNDEDCKAPKQFHDEKAAINYALHQFEYIKEADSEEIAALDKFMAPLIGKSFGKNEKDCSDWPLVFNQYPNQRQKNTYKIMRSGLTCTFQKGQIIGNNLMVKSVCLDEDSPLALANHILSYDGRYLTLAASSSSWLDEIFINKVEACQNTPSKS